MPYTILVPHDGSDAAEDALAWSKRLVASAGGSIHLILVLALPTASWSPMPVALPYPSAEDLRAAKAELAAVVARNELADTPEVLVAASVGDAVVEAASQAGATLIVMGTHGRGGLKRAVLGSVADHVVRHAGCPVVTLRHLTPPADASRRGGSAGGPG